MCIGPSCHNTLEQRDEIIKSSPRVLEIVMVVVGKIRFRKQKKMYKISGPKIKRQKKKVNAYTALRTVPKCVTQDLYLLGTITVVDKPGCLHPPKQVSPIFNVS